MKGKHNARKSRMVKETIGRLVSPELETGWLIVEGYQAMAEMNERFAKFAESAAIEAQEGHTCGECASWDVQSYEACAYSFGAGAGDTACDRFAQKEEK